MKQFVKLAVVAAAAICASTPSTFAFEPPPICLSSTNFSAWRDSVHMLLVTNYTPDRVEITVLIEKPATQGAYWGLYLDLYDGTNRVAQLDIAYDLLGPEQLELTGAKVMAVKAVQRFSLSVSPNSLRQSTVSFAQRLRLPRPWQGGTVTGTFVVRLADVAKGATGGFREGQPIFGTKQ